MFSEEHGLIIWKSCMNKNEDISKASFKILLDLLKGFSGQALKLLLKEMSKIKVQDFDEELIKYAIAHTNRAYAIKKTHPERATNTYDLDILWIVLIEGLQPERLKQLVLQNFCDILKQDEDEKKKYIQIAGMCFTDNKDIVFLRVLVELKFADFLANIKKDVMNLDTFVNTHKLIESAVLACEEYHKQIGDEIVRNPEISPNLFSFSLPRSRGIPFEKQAGIYLEFLQQVCFASYEIQLSPKHLDMLWNVFFIKSFSPQHSNIWWQVLGFSEGSRIGFFSCRKNAERFFMQYFLDSSKFPFALLTPSAINCFILYFEYVNKALYTKNIKDFTGANILWDIAITCSNSKAREKVSDYIVLKYSNFIFSETKKEENIKDFLSQVLNRKKSTLDEYCNSFNILHKFFDRLNQNNYEKEIDENLYTEFPQVELKFVKPDSTTNFNKFFPEELKTPNLLKWLSKYLQVSVDRITLKNEMGVEVTYEPMKFLSTYSKVFIILKDKTLSAVQNPELVLASDFEQMEKLISLLSSISAPEIVDEIWNFVCKLPINKENMKKYFALNPPSCSEADWLKYFEIKSINDCGHLAYTLNGFLKFCRTLEGKEKIKEYKELFVKKNGLEFVCNIFSKNISSTNKSKISLLCQSRALKIMAVMWNESFKISEESKKAFWVNIEHTLFWLLSPTTQSEVTKALQGQDRRILIGSCLEIHYLLCVGNPVIFAGRVICEKYLDNIKLSIFDSDNLLREISRNWFKKVYDKFKDGGYQETVLSVFLNNYLTYAMGINSSEVTTFYAFLSEMLKSIDLCCIKNAISIAKIESISDYIFSALQKPNINEHIGFSLFGTMDILAIYIKRISKSESSKANSIKSLNKNLYNALVEFIFGIDNTGKRKKSLCTNKEAYKSSMNLLYEIMKVTENFYDFIKKLQPLHCSGSFRSNNTSEWEIRPSTVSGNPNGLVGLENLGSTCYMNSVLQQLFSVKPFREELLLLDHSLPDSSVLTQVQKVMGILHECEFSTYRPHKLCESMGLETGLQRDSAEFLITLFSSLEECLQQTYQKNLIKEIFEIKTVAEVVCSSCHRRTEHVFSNFLLDLEIRNKKSILDSLSTLVKSETLQGDNAYACEVCKKKVSAERYESLKVLPNVLIIHLKRFEHQYDGDTKKLNSFCEFPFELNLEKFTQDFVRKNSPSFGQKSATLSPSDSQYTLKGVVVHSGSLNYGHYFSIIKEERTELWVQFNDSIVMPYSLDQLKEDSFGRKDNGEGDNATNAYLLIYEKKNWKESHTSPEISRSIYKNEDDKRPKKIIKSLSATLGKQLAEEKEMFACKQLLFQPEYINFIHHMLDENIQNMPKIASFGLLAFLSNCLRSDCLEKTHKIAVILQKHCEENPVFCKEVIETFLNENILREFFINCPKAEARQATTRLVQSAIKKYYQNNASEVNYLLKNYNKYSPCVELLNIFLKQANQINFSYCGNYFEMLKFFSELSEEMFKYLFLHYAIGLCLKQILDENAKDFSENIVKLLKFNWVSSEPILVPIGDASPLVDKRIVDQQFLGQMPQIMGCLESLLLGTRIYKLTLSADCEGLSLLLFDKMFYLIFNKCFHLHKSLLSFSSLLSTLCELHKGGNATDFASFIMHTVKICPIKKMQKIVAFLVMLLQNEYMLNSLLELLCDAIEEEMSNAKFAYAKCMLFVDFLIKLCQTNEEARKRMTGFSTSKNVKNMLNTALRFVIEHKIVEKHYTIFSNSSATLPDESQSIQMMSTEANIVRISLLESLKKKKWNDSEPILDIVTSSETLKPGLLYDLNVFSLKKWLPAEVVYTTFNSVKVRYQETSNSSTELWIDPNLERLAFLATKDNPRNYEIEMLFYLHQQL